VIRALLALALATGGCGDDDDDSADAGPDDAGPWATGELTCAHQPLADYADREYSFADGFDRQGLGRNWHSDASDAWAIEDERHLVATGEGAPPGALAMVADGQPGSEIVAWVDVAREAGWDGAPAVLCRADGPPVTTGHGVRVTAAEMELVEVSADGAVSGHERADLASSLPDAGSARLVVGCTGTTLTAFVFALGEGAPALLGCVSRTISDDPASGAVALTQTSGRTAFDDVRVELVR